MEHTTFAVADIVPGKVMRWVARGINVDLIFILENGKEKKTRWLLPKTGPARGWCLVEGRAYANAYYSKCIEKLNEVARTEHCQGKITDQMLADAENSATHNLSTRA